MQCAYIQITPRRTIARLIIIVQPKLVIRAIRQLIIQMQTCLAIHLRIMFPDVHSLTKTNNRQVERSIINAKCVRGVLIANGSNSVTCVPIQDLVNNHISVKYEISTLPSHRTLNITCMFILERNHTNANYVISAFLSCRTLKSTCLFILERNHISAKCVISAFPSCKTSKSTYVFILERNRICAKYVMNVFPILKT